MNILYKYENIENYTKKTILSSNTGNYNGSDKSLNVLKEEAARYGLPILTTTYGYKLEDESTDTIVYYFERNI